MGSPKQVEPVKINANYDWGAFGSADERGVTLGGAPQSTVNSTQAGIKDYVNELINPLYSSTSFRARQGLLDSAANQYARTLSADAMGRNARGSGMMSALNKAIANRSNQL